MYRNHLTKFQSDQEENTHWEKGQMYSAVNEHAIADMSGFRLGQRSLRSHCLPQS